MDPTHLHQILWNLCDNAVKYASAAAGAISVELTCGALERPGARSSKSRIAAPASIPIKSRRCSSRSTQASRAERDSAFTFRGSSPNATAQRFVIIHGLAAVACSAWYSPIRAAGIPPKRRYEPGCARRRRRATHLRAAVDHARAMDISHAHVRERRERQASLSGRSICA